MSEEKRNKIEETISDCYWNYKRARLPKYNSLLPPPDEPWSTSEVYSLIRDIMMRCNSELAKRYLEE